MRTLFFDISHKFLPIHLAAETEALVDSCQQLRELALVPSECEHVQHVEELHRKEGGLPVGIPSAAPEAKLLQDSFKHAEGQLLPVRRRH